MIFRRSPEETPPPWRVRLDRSRELIRSNAPDPALQVRLDRIDEALAQADADRTRLAAAVSQLDPAAVSRELKDALRRRPDPRAADTVEIATLRRRYESVQGLQNSLVDIDRRVETTLVDLEAYAARVVELAFRSPGSGGDLAAQLDALHADATALSAAHDEIERLEKGTMP